MRSSSPHQHCQRHTHAQPGVAEVWPSIVSLQNVLTAYNTTTAHAAGAPGPASCSLYSKRKAGCPATCQEGSALRPNWVNNGPPGLQTTAGTCRAQDDLVVFLIAGLAGTIHELSNGGFLGF
jgi:hypothetical protein